MSVKQQLDSYITQERERDTERLDTKVILMCVSNLCLSHDYHKIVLVARGNYFIQENPTSED